MVEDCSHIKLYENLCVFIGIAMLKKNILSIRNFSSKMKLTSKIDTFKMVIHRDLHQMN